MSPICYKRTSRRLKLKSALPPKADIRWPMFVSASDRGPEAIFCWKYAESIIDRGYFVGLFLQGVARQANATAGAMVGELGGRALAWKRTLERDERPRHGHPMRRRHRHTRFARAPGGNWQGFFRAKGRWGSGVRNYKTLSALGRWFGVGQDEIFSSLVGSAGCKIPGLVWLLP